MDEGNINRPPIRGDNFTTQDSLAASFGKLNIEVLRIAIDKGLALAKQKGFTGIQEELEFDKNGLLIGTYKPGSLVSVIKLRARQDLQEFMEKIGEGRKYDAAMTSDNDSGKTFLTFSFKNQQLSPKILKLKTRTE